MPRALVQMPNTVTLDNQTAVPVDIDGLAKLAASETGKVIDLTVIDSYNGHYSRRQSFWNALAGLVEAGQVVIDSSVPALSPAFDYATLDGPGFGDEAADGLALRPGLPGYVSDSVRPEVVSAVVVAGSAYVTVTFTEGVFSSADPAGPIEAADFAFSNFVAGSTITALDLDGTILNGSGGAVVGGETVVRLGLDVTGAADSDSTFDLAPVAGAIIDNKGNEALAVVEAGITTAA